MSDPVCHSPQTLAIDIGGTGLKASVLDDSRKMVEKHVRVPTPSPCTPDILVKALVKSSRLLDRRSPHRTGR